MDMRAHFFASHMAYTQSQIQQQQQQSAYLQGTQQQPVARFTQAPAPMQVQPAAPELFNTQYQPQYTTTPNTSPPQAAQILSPPQHAVQHPTHLKPLLQSASPFLGLPAPKQAKRQVNVQEHYRAVALPGATDDTLPAAAAAAAAPVAAAAGVAGLAGAPQQDCGEGLEQAQGAPQGQGQGRAQAQAENDHIIHRHHTPSVTHPTQPSPPPLADPPCPEDPETGILRPDCEPGGAPCIVRPCLHNDWDDVRTRKGSKILRCRLCQRKWKLASASIARCSAFMQGTCPNLLQCAYLHVHKKKSVYSATLDMSPDEMMPPTDELMPPLASPDATPPASPSALIAALRVYCNMPLDPESPVSGSTEQLLELLRKTVLDAPPTPMAVTKGGGLTPAAARQQQQQLAAEDPAGDETPIVRLPPAGVGGTGLAARRAFKKQAVAIPSLETQHRFSSKCSTPTPRVKCVTHNTIIFESPTAGRPTMSVSFEKLREYVQQS